MNSRFIVYCLYNPYRVFNFLIKKIVSREIFESPKFSKVRNFWKSHVFKKCKKMRKSEIFGNVMFGKIAKKCKSPKILDSEIQAYYCIKYEIQNHNCLVTVRCTLKGDTVLSNFLLNTVLSNFDFYHFIQLISKIPFYPTFNGGLKIPFYPTFFYFF